MFRSQDHKICLVQSSIIYSNSQSAVTGQLNQCAKLLETYAQSIRNIKYLLSTKQQRKKWINCHKFWKMVCIT